MLCMGLYLAAVFSVTGIPDIRSFVFEPTLHLLPFVDIVNSPLFYVRNSLLNIVLFVPFGMIVPVLWESVRSLRQIAALGFCVSFFIEVSQLFTFRLTDIDDLIMNMAGAAAGFLLLRIFLKKGGAKQKSMEEVRGGTGEKEFVVWFIAIFLLKFFVTPFLSGVIWEIIL